MTTVYVLTDGKYSDYGIIGIFSTREKAEEYVKENNDGPHPGWWTRYSTDRIEEWDLDPCKAQV